jgi:hypothetical protein
LRQSLSIGLWKAVLNRDFLHGLEAERLVIDHDRVQEGLDHAQQLGVQDHLLVARMEAALHPACTVHEQVDPAHDRAPQAEHALVGRLGIERVRGAHVGAPIGHAIAPGELATDHRRAHVLRCPEGGRARLHVDVGGEAAIDDRRARAYHLGQDDGGQGLRVLLGQGTGQGHRSHGATQRERGDAHDLVTRREGHDALEHRRVQTQRRARVDDGEDRWLEVDGRLVDAARDADHLQDIDVALAAEAVAVDGLVHEGQGVERGVQVAHAVVDVHRLHGVAGQEVDRRQRLAQAQQVLVVLAVADAPTTVQVGDVGRATHGPECHPVATDGQMMGRVPGVQRELARGGGDQLGDHLRIEAHALIVRRRLGAGRLERIARIDVEEVHADLSQDAQRGGVDGFEFVGRDDVGRAVAQARLRPRALGRSDLAIVALAAARPAPRHVGLDQGIDVGQRGYLAGMPSRPVTAGRTARYRATPWCAVPRCGARPSGGGLPRQVEPGGLELGVAIQGVERLVTAETGLLEAAERHRHVGRVEGVDEDDPGPQRPGQLVGLVDVTRP